MLQDSAVNKTEQENLMLEDLNQEEENSLTPGLLVGEFDEEESKRSFQEALQQWRLGSRAAGWTPTSPGKWSLNCYCGGGTGVTDWLVLRLEV